jgi:hypothetical protein
MFLRNAGIYPQVHTALQNTGTDIFIAGRTSNLISMVITFIMYSTDISFFLLKPRPHKPRPVSAVLVF